MIVIDWAPNGQGGFFANVMYDHEHRQRWIWDGKGDQYVKLLSPDQKAAHEDMQKLNDNRYRYTDEEYIKMSKEISGRM